MSILIVANDPKQWPFQIPDVEVIDAWTYLTSTAHTERRGVKLFNLCKSYRYQSTGYYVSLLAEARGHRPQPSVMTMQDLKSQTMVRMVSNELEELIQKSLQPLGSNHFTLSIYFGRNLAKRYDRLSLSLFNLFQSPLLRAQFAKDEDGAWELRNISPIAASEVPHDHWAFVVDAATRYFSGKHGTPRRKARSRYDLAILHNPDEAQPPSDKKALQKFIKAAESMGIGAELITRDDYSHLAEFDALFIRETTFVNHHTYRFARRAASEGLVVVDDPESILRCSNKVYLAELLDRHDIPTPKTMVVHKGNTDQVAPTLGFPVVLKTPDGAFSKGVTKVETQEKLDAKLEELLDDSDMVVAQEFLPTTFDWRIGIVDQKPFFACKYFMAKNHWQIIKHGENGEERDYGRFETLPVEMAPRRAVSTALKAANLIGDGLYGVDVKQSGDKFYIIEVNDNPNMDAGVEDQILRDELYNRVMSVFLHRIERRKAGLPGE